jgi:hypothetical protein
MKSTYKNLFRIAIVAITAVLFCAASCEKSEKATEVKSKDTNPYSKTRNEKYSMLGVSLKGSRFIQYTHNHLFSPDIHLSWNIVEIDKEEFIIINAFMVPASASIQVARVKGIWLLFPFSNVEIGKEYSTTDYSSLVRLWTDNHFIIDGKETSQLQVPLNVSVVYTYLKDKVKIQGKFTADGGKTIETLNGDPLNVLLKEGVFNLTHGSQFNPNYTLDDWRSEFE